MRAPSGAIMWRGMACRAQSRCARKGSNRRKPRMTPSIRAMAWPAKTRWLTSPLLVTQTPSGSPALSATSMPTVVNCIHLSARPLSRTSLANSGVKAEL